MHGKKKPGFNLATAKLLGTNFWIVTLVGAIFMLARFSEAFLIIKASEVGLSARYVPLVLVVMSLVYSLTSYPVGVLIRQGWPARASCFGACRAVCR